MNEHFIQIIVPVVGLVSGLIATYVSLENRALLAEVRGELAEMESKIFLRINGTYDPVYNYTRMCSCFKPLSNHASLSSAGWPGI